jgi:eukaryotic-like serine/threonine-protein kinase
MADIGDLLDGKYRLIRLLGEGGMGAVYEARHEQIGKGVAVKVLHPELTRVSEAATRFTREAQAAAAVGHRGIIDIHDIGTHEEDGSIFLVMELLDGENLGDLLLRQCPLDLQLTCYIVCQVLSALDAAHAAGIVHRDLKPDNIFLVRSGQKLPDVKLLDFGISKMTDASNPEDRLTRTGIAMGTPYYMSPEQAVGAKDLDHRVDIWAMGVILYECLTGRVPFTADNGLAILRKITDAPLESPRLHRPEIPIELEAVILRAMNRDLDRRLRTSVEMLSAIIPLMDDHVADRVSLPRGLDYDALRGVAETLRGGESGSIIAKKSAGPSSRGEAAHGAGGAKPSSRRDGATSVTWERTGAAAVAKPRTSRAFAIGVGALLIGVAIGGAALWSSSRAELPAPAESLAQEALQATANVGAAAPAQQDADGDDPAARQSDTVSIALEELPRGARLSLDGEHINELPIKLPRADREHELTVEADGYLPWTKSVTARRDATITVNLELDVALLQPAAKRDLPRRETVEHRISKSPNSGEVDGAVDRRPTKVQIDRAVDQSPTSRPAVAPTPPPTTKSGQRYGQELLPERPSYGSEL